MIIGEILEKDITKKDMKALIELYHLETEKIKQDTNVRKEKIKKAIKKLGNK